MFHNFSVPDSININSVNPDGFVRWLHSKEMATMSACCDQPGCHQIVFRNLSRYSDLEIGVGDPYCTNMVLGCFDIVRCDEFGNTLKVASTDNLLEIATNDGLARSFHNGVPPHASQNQHR